MKYFLIILCYGLFSSIPCFSQLNDPKIELVVNQVALLSIDSNNDKIDLGFSVPKNAGEAIRNDLTNSDKFLHFTSAVVEGNTRRVLASISSSILPSGYDIYVEALNFITSGVGSIGVSSGKKKIDRSSITPIISDIGGGATGIGTSCYKLRFSLGINDYGQLKSTIGETYTIIFTLTEN